MKNSVIHILVVGSIFLSCAIAEGRVTQRTADNVCGPRCVQFVLSHFGIDVSLPELVRQSQWPIDGGASLSALKRSLESKGIFVKAIWVRHIDRISSGLSTGRRQGLA